MTPRAEQEQPPDWWLRQHRPALERNREILRLHRQGELLQREIAARVGVCRSTVSKVIRRYG